MWTHDDSAFTKASRSILHPDVYREPAMSQRFCSLLVLPAISCSTLNMSRAAEPFVNLIHRLNPSEAVYLERHV